MATRSNGRSLRLADFSDRELLALVADHEDSEGWADSLTVAEAIWPRYASEEPQAARASVARRFSWMRRWGVMEWDAKQIGKWRLTDEGRLMVAGRLSAKQEEALLELGDEHLMSLGYLMSDRYQRAGDVSAVLLRRAMQFAQLQRGRR